MKVDKFNEACNLAGTDASVTLSKLIQRPVDIDILPARIVKSDKAPLIIGSGEMVVGITTQILGDMKGFMTMFYRKHDALLLCDLLLKREAKQTLSFSDAEISALNEVSNIIVGNFLSALASPLQVLSILHKQPIFKFDSYAVVMNDVAKIGLLEAEDVFYLQIMLKIQPSNIKSFIVVMLKAEDVKNVIDRL